MHIYLKIKKKKIELDLAKYDANKNKCIKEKRKTDTNDMQKGKEIFRIQLRKKENTSS